ncbi:hypothetical protein OOT46_26130 [Aquabacterium sp. A7-Y]|uniref:hypothetical protein n=1 Tax=Aquabacterium sp. A7-Y TaxID=1349605 RepID=UPI00223CC5F1|nr:hypothetical protein [Aquabacterium sp. A7-Y]MCW7541293.1 hypothetical protein [Aquabacterium sp. A7-Y]
MQALIEQVTRLKQCADAVGRSVIADEINDVFEYQMVPPARVDQAVLHEVASDMVALAVSETDGVARESLLHALVSIYSHAYQQGEALDIAPLMQMLDALSETEIEYVLYIFGFSCDIHCLSTIERFSTHSNETIRRAAQQARQDLLLRRDP